MTLTRDRLQTGGARQAATGPQAAVWDPFVRLFHWSLAGAVLAAAVTGYLLGATWIDIHVWAGTAMAALVAARIVWGFAGGSYARFSGFVPSPRAVLDHLRHLAAGRAGRHLGHNPLGALMVLALLAAAAGLAATGVVALGGMLKSGPLAFATTFATGRTARALHELLAALLLGLIGLHVAGAIFESLRTRDNLVRAMLTGRKPRRDGDHVPAPRRARPVAAGAAVVLTMAAGLGATASLSSKPALGVPSRPLDAAFAEECGACHMPYHPSLLPAASWRSMFTGLDDHFGEDASLVPDTTADLAAYAEANAAETYDSLPANVFRQVDASAPFAITKTPFWTWRHAGISDAVFRSGAVRSPANCAACHRDAASGLFSPSRIAIPEEVL